MNDASKTLAGALLIGGSLLTGNAALITAAAGVGVNWSSDGLLGLWQRWRDRKLDTPLARAYQHAIQTATRTLADEYRRTVDNRATPAAFALVAECATQIGNAEYPPGELSADAAQAQLTRGLEGLLHGHEPRPREFLQAHLLQAVAVALRDALAADGEAWRRFHGWLIEDLRASQTALTVKLEQVSEVAAQLSDASAALVILQSASLRIEVIAGRIDTRTERIETKLDQLHAHMTTKKESNSTGAVFINSDWTVNGNVIQGDNLTINNDHRSRSRAESDPPTTPAHPINRVALKDWLMRYFDSRELDNLCFNIRPQLAQAGYPDQLGLELIGGIGLPDQCRRLIEWLEARDALHLLVAEAGRQRPNVPPPG